MISLTRASLAESPRFSDATHSAAFFSMSASVFAMALAGAVAAFVLAPIAVGNTRMPSARRRAAFDFMSKELRRRLRRREIASALSHALEKFVAFAQSPHADVLVLEHRLDDPQNRFRAEIIAMIKSLDAFE